MDEKSGNRYHKNGRKWSDCTIIVHRRIHNGEGPSEETGRLHINIGITGLKRERIVTSVE